MKKISLLIIASLALGLSARADSTKSQTPAADKNSTVANAAAIKGDTLAVADPAVQQMHDVVTGYEPSNEAVIVSSVEVRLYTLNFEDAASMTAGDLKKQSFREATDAEAQVWMKQYGAVKKIDPTHRLLVKMSPKVGDRPAMPSAKLDRANKNAPSSKI